MAGCALLDIEGTIADIAFVKHVLFPYARDALPGFIAEHADEPAVAKELAATAREAGLDPDNRDALVDQLLAWIDADVKATPLKQLQGMVWKNGYASGAFTAHLYPDAFAWIEREHAAGTPLYVYSSGSIAAQQLYFGHSDFGDLRDRFKGFFDTTTGPKKQADSYRVIAARIHAETGLAHPRSGSFPTSAMNWPPPQAPA
ncbi:MAG: acireductone synthase [Wenzhouxiangellaceae bacterium]|nr:acireductone synthase [Wenzhouxiangellaceae bacterium]